MHDLLDNMKDDNMKPIYRVKLHQLSDLVTNYYELTLIDLFEVVMNGGGCPDFLGERGNKMKTNNVTTLFISDKCFRLKKLFLQISYNHNKAFLTGGRGGCEQFHHSVVYTIKYHVNYVHAH